MLNPYCQQLTIVHIRDEHANDRGADKKSDGQSANTRKIQRVNRPSKQLPKFPSKDKVEKFIAEKKLQTPYLIVDLDVVENNYTALRRTLPMAEVFYAVKANPAFEVVKRLVKLGSSFDVASPAEINWSSTLEHPLKRSPSATPSKKNATSPTHTSKACGCSPSTPKPNSKSSRAQRQAQSLLPPSHERAKAPTGRSRANSVARYRWHAIFSSKQKQPWARTYGVSFHVGSQQTRIDQWDIALAQTARLFKHSKEGSALSSKWSTSAADSGSLHRFRLSCRLVLFFHHQSARHTSPARKASHHH
jgi:hypothetical protein